MTPSLLADFVIAAILVMIAAHAIHVHHRRGWLAFDPLNAFWGGVLVIYILQPIEYGRILVFWYGTEIFEQTLLWCLFGFFFLIVGYESRLGVIWSRHYPSLAPRLEPSKTWLLGVAMALLGTTSYIVTMIAVGGFDAWSALGRAKSAAAEIPGYIAVLEVLLPAGIGLLVFHAQMHRVPPLRRILIWTLAIALLLFFFYIGSRSRLLGLIAILFAAYYLPKRKNPPLLLVVATFVVLLVTVTLMGLFRDQFRDLSINLEEGNVEQALTQTFPSLFGDENSLEKMGLVKGMEFSCAMAAVKLVPETVPYNYGYSELEFFTRLIPRAVWPEKRYPHYEAFTPIYAKADLSTKWVPYASKPILQGPAFGFIGHWHAVGGAVALVIAGILTGALYRSIREWFTSQPGEGTTLIYASVIMIGFFDAAATPLFWIFTMPFVLIAMLITIRLCRLGR